MGRPFPQFREEFQNDERITFYGEDEKWILEDENGVEWEWVELSKKWVQALDEHEVAQQQQAYGASDADNGPTAEEEFKNKKRKMAEQAKADGSNKKQKAEKENTAIYVTSIPLDATFDEIYQEFKRYGLIQYEIDSDKPRIKMYTDEAGDFKGDALIVYHQAISVQQAINIADDSDFRPGTKGPDGPMRVRQADTSYKRTKAADDTNGNGSAAQPARKGKKGDKQKIIEKTKRLERALADWSDDEDGGAILNPEVKGDVKKHQKHDRVIVLKNMFKPSELELDIKEDPEYMEWFMEDIKSMCEKKGGEVEELKVWDLEEAGVVTVRFMDGEDARKAAAALDGSGAGSELGLVSASMWAGEKYKKKEIDEEEERKRLDAFAQRLETMPDE